MRIVWLFLRVAVIAAIIGGGMTFALVSFGSFVLQLHGMPWPEDATLVIAILASAIGFVIGLSNTLISHEKRR